jgi:hypothetical protein
MAPKPELKAFLLCDYIIHEAGTGKKSLIGIFEQMHSPKFPFRAPRLSVYANFSDAHGTYELAVRLVRLRDGKVIFDARGMRVSVSDPLQVSELGVNLEGIPFEEPGKYEFALYANEQFLQSKPFRVVKVEPAPGAPGAPPVPGAVPPSPPAPPGA